MSASSVLLMWTPETPSSISFIKTSVALRLMRCASVWSWTLSSMRITRFCALGTVISVCFGFLPGCKRFLPGRPCGRPVGPNRRTATDLATPGCVLLPLGCVLRNDATTRAFGKRRGAGGLRLAAAHDAWRQRIVSEATLLLLLRCGRLSCRRRLCRGLLCGRLRGRCASEAVQPAPGPRPRGRFLGARTRSRAPAPKGGGCCGRFGNGLFHWRGRRRISRHGLGLVDLLASLPANDGGPKFVLRPSPRCGPCRANV